MNIPIADIPGPDTDDKCWADLGNLAIYVNFSSAIQLKHFANQNADTFPKPRFKPGEGQPYYNLRAVRQFLADFRAK